MNPRLRYVPRTLAIFVLGLAAQSTLAATLCVTAGDSIGLQGALNFAASDGEPDVIELQAGQYPMPTNLVLSYAPAAGETFDLTIEGGYGPNFGNDCGLAPQVPDATATVLDGGQLRISLAASGSVTLKGLTLQSAFGMDPTHAPIEITGSAGATGNITIENAMFLDNGSTQTSVINLSAALGAVTVQNTLFASNTSFAQANAIRIRSVRNGSICALVLDSTFAANSSSSPALYLLTPMCTAVLANDIFWNQNFGGDVELSTPASTYVLSDDFADIAETAGTQAADLVSVDPKFNADFSLKDLSPLRDLGATGGSIFSPGAFDVAGRPRAYSGGAPDIGAFEIQDVIFASGFDFQAPF